MPRKWDDIPIRLRDRIVDVLRQQRASEDMHAVSRDYAAETPMHEAWDAAIDLLGREGDER